MYVNIELQAGQYQSIIIHLCMHIYVEVKQLYPNSFDQREFAGREAVKPEVMK